MERSITGLELKIFYTWSAKRCSFCVLSVAPVVGQQVE